MHDGPISMPGLDGADQTNERRPENDEMGTPTTSTGLIEVIDVQRRAPFGDSPTVGPRGKGTQQRILAAALEMFGQLGYRVCRVEHITAAVGCSRPSFYQYFSSKQDLFRQLAGQVAREQFRLSEDMDDVTPDAAGWNALRSWLEASAELYETNWPVYEAFSVAVNDDDLVGSGAQKVGQHQSRAFSRKIDPSAFTSFAPEELSLILASASGRANRYRHFLERVEPHRAPERDRMLDCLAEVLHRMLFGGKGGGFIDHRPLDRSFEARAPIAAPNDGIALTLGPTGRATYTRLLDAAADTFCAQGFHDTRVDDIVEAAGTSHGTFYRYFENKSSVFRAVASRSAGRTYRTIGAVGDIVDPDGTISETRLWSWVDTYTHTWDDEGSILRVWIETFGRDESLGAAIAQGLDVIRGAFAGVLDTRRFGDADIDAFLLMSVVDLGSHDGQLGRENRRDTLLKVLRRGFLGLDDET